MHALAHPAARIALPARALPGRTPRLDPGALRADAREVA